MTSGAWSPDFKVNVAIGMVNKEFWNGEKALYANSPSGKRKVQVREKFWI